MGVMGGKNHNHPSMKNTFKSLSEGYLRLCRCDFDKSSGCLPKLQNVLLQAASQ